MLCSTENSGIVLYFPCTVFETWSSQTRRNRPLTYSVFSSCFPETWGRGGQDEAGGERKDTSVSDGGEADGRPHTAAAATQQGAHTTHTSETFTSGIHTPLQCHLVFIRSWLDMHSFYWQQCMRGLIWIQEICDFTRFSQLASLS